MSDNASTILKKLNSKIDGLEIQKAAAKEIKAELKELAGLASSEVLNEKLEQLSTKLDSLDSNNTSMKESVHDFVTSTTKTLETILKSNNNENSTEELKDFLKELDNKIETITSEKPTNIPDETNFNKLKKELTFFQNELEMRFNDNLNGTSETINKIITELNHQMQDLQDSVDKNSEKLVTNILSDVKQIKADTLEIVEGVKNIDNKAIKNTEKKINEAIALSQESTGIIVNEVQELKNITAKSAVLDSKTKETIEIFKNELTSLKNNIHTQIREVLSKIVVQDEIKFLCEEAISGIKSNGTETDVLRKHIKDIKAEDEKHAETLNEIKNIVSELSEFEFNENSDKIDIIYENIAMLNNWAGSSDKLAENFDMLRNDFDENSDKIDIVYENLSFINEWVKTLDKIYKDIENIRKKCEIDIDVTKDIQEINENINALKILEKKNDILSLQVRALSVQLSETESTTNANNLNDMKKMMIQLNDNFADLNNHNNNILAETNKINENIHENMSSIISETNKINENIHEDINSIISETTKISEAVHDNIDLVLQLNENIADVNNQSTLLVEASDKTNSTMQGHLDTLKTLIYDFEQRSPKLLVEKLLQEFDEIKQVSTKQSGFENVILESFSYLAEWMDSTGSLINNIKADLISLKSQQSEGISEYKQSFANEQSITNEKIQQLQILIQNLKTQQNQELEEIISKKPNDNTEISNALREFGEFVGQKIENVEKRTSKEIVNSQAEVMGILSEISNLQTFSAQDNTTSEILETLQNISSKIENQPIPADNSEVLNSLKNLEQLIKQNEEKNQELINKLTIEAENEKAEKVDNSFISDSSDIKNILEFIASQVVNTNENILKTDMLAQKIESMETRINSFEHYIAKLVDYLDED